MFFSLLQNLTQGLEEINTLPDSTQYQGEKFSRGHQTCVNIRRFFIKFARTPPSHYQTREGRD
jgi:hypothetical protein